MYIKEQVRIPAALEEWMEHSSVTIVNRIDNIKPFLRFFFLRLFDKGLSECSTGEY